LPQRHKKGGPGTESWTLLQVSVMLRPRRRLWNLRERIVPGRHTRRRASSGQPQPSGEAHSSPLHTGASGQFCIRCSTSAQLHTSDGMAPLELATYTPIIAPERAKVKFDVGGVCRKNVGHRLVGASHSRRPMKGTNVFPCATPGSQNRGLPLFLEHSFQFLAKKPPKIPQFSVIYPHGVW